MIAVVVLAVNVGLSALDSATRGADESSPTSSSFSTGHEGLAAYATLLRHYGVDVRQQRGPIDEAVLEPSRTTIILLDPRSVDDRAVSSLRSFVEHGGRLVAGGTDPTWLDRLVDDGPTWSSSARRRYSTTSTEAEAKAFRVVRADGRGSWAQPGRATVIAGTRRESLAVVDDVGRGRVVLLADASPVRNRLLDRVDNAAFALGIVGEKRAVVFAEGVHGYGESSGLSAVPDRWKIALGLALLATFLFALAGGRVIGGPEQGARTLPPARGAYVTALARVLQGSRERAEAVAPLQRRSRDELVARLGLPPEIDGIALRRIATERGFDGVDVDALLRPAQDPQAVLAVGQARARLEGERR
ncbi:MAG: DUF4350 domain-containing protein [Acidimicrobiia bacterium]